MFTIIKKNAGAFILLLCMFFGVVFIGFNQNELGNITQAFRSIKPIYLIYCIIGWFCFLYLDTLTIKYYLADQGHFLSLGACFHGAISGLFYSNITPGASGGQPMQIFTLKRHGVPFGLAASTVTAKFFIFECVLLLSGTVFWIANYDFVNKNLSGLIWLIILGYIANFFSIALVLCIMISKKITKKLIGFCITCAVKIKLCKKPEEARIKWDTYCENYEKSIKTCFKNPKGLIWLSVITFFQIIAMMSPGVILIFAFNNTQTSVIGLLAISILLYISAGYTPLPGSSGMQEFGFVKFFKAFYAPAQLFISLLLWRFFSYYINVIVGLVVSMCEPLIFKKKKEKV